MGDSEQFKSGTLPHLIQLRTQDVSPPSSLYIERDDTLGIVVWNTAPAATLLVTARLLLPNGDIIASQWNLTPTTAGLTNAFTFDLAEGFLLSIVATATTSGIRHGNCFVRMVINRAGVVGAIQAGALLAQGYISGNDVVGWPFGTNEFAVNGRGFLRVIVGSTPAAGAEILETVPVARRWRLVGFLFVLTTNATVANRLPILRITDGANLAYDAAAPTVQAASLAVTYQAVAGSSPFDTGQNFKYLPLPIPAEVNGGWQITTLTSNLQAGDQYSSVRYYVQEWTEL